jgi:hypothetical protein
MTEMSGGNSALAGISCIWPMWIDLTFFFFKVRQLLCSPGFPVTHFLDQAGFEIRDMPASVLQVLG